MKNKSFAFLSLALLSVLILTSFASAVSPTIIVTGVPTLNLSSGSFTINLTDSATENVNLLIPNITQDSKTITFTPSLTNPISLTAGVITPVTINYIVPSDFSFHYGQTYSSTLTVTNIAATATNSQTVSFPINNPSLATGYTDNNHLDVSIDDVKVESGYGSDYQWYPLDQISAKITVDNNAADKMKNIVVKYGLYDVDAGRWIFTDSQSSFSLNDGDSKSLSVNFVLDSVSKFKTSDNYKFYAWATGTDESASGNKTVSDSNSNNVQDIDMQFDTDLVTLANLQVPTTASCGQEVQITADVTNIGTDDQSGVYVKIINTNLGINQKINVGDVNSLESSSLDFTFTVPADVDEGSYPIELMVYDESNNVYKSDLNGDEARSQPTLSVQGSCSTVPLATVTAASTSDAKAGQELTIKATVVNTGSSTATYNLGLSGYADWATLENIDKTSVTLAAGTSQDVLIKLNLNKDVSGDKSFSIVLTQGDKILNQPVTVSVASQSIFSGITGLFAGAGSNWYLWGIAALNVLLVLIIIVVAVKVARKR